MSRLRPSHRLRPAALLGASIAVACLLGLAAGTARSAGSALGWASLGFAGYEFTSLLSPPGNACVVAWTGLNNGGLGVSTDCGDQYARLFLPSAYDVTAQNENIGYVAAGTLGMVKTIDTGTNWYPINDGLPTVGRDARAVILHVARPESVFCGLYGGGVFIGGPKAALNDTIRWQAMNAGLIDLRVRALARVRGGTFLVAGTEGGIERWSNGSWSSVAPGVIVNAFVIDSGDSNKVYAATEGGVYRSTNQGLSWFPSSTGLPAVPVNDIARRTDGLPVLYAGTRGQGVWESADGGANWRKFGPNLPGDNDVRAVLCTVGAAAADSAMVFAGTRADGLFRAEYSTPAATTSWGRIKETYRR